jgi:hypothetical protein
MSDDRPPFEERLHKAICASYDIESLEQMVRFRLTERLDMVAPKGGRLDVVVFELILWAERIGRMADLVRSAADYVPGRMDLSDLRQEFEASAKPPAKATGTITLPMGPPSLPEDLIRLMQGYDRIPAVIADGPARATMMEQTAGQIGELDLAKLRLAERLHLSESAGERLAAILALDEAPDPQYLRWLSERVSVESPFAGYAAAVALTNAAHLLDRPHLGRVRAQAQDGLDRLPNTPDFARRRMQLQRAVHLTDRRTGYMTSRPDIPFDECAAALAEAFTPADLQSLLKAQLDVALESLVPIKNRIERVVYYLIVTADQAGWDHDLIKIAAAARPSSGKLTKLAALYATV